MVISLTVGVLGLTVLVSLQALVVAGRWRRGQWRRRVQTMAQAKSPPTERQIRSAHQARKTSGFLSRQLGRVYYVITAVSALTLIVLPFLRLETTTRLTLWLTLTGLMMGAALIMTFYWYGWDDDVERALAKWLSEAQEHALQRRGLPVRDPHTGVYTREFWLHSLEGKIHRPFRRPRPTTCLVIEVTGLSPFTEQHGEQASRRLLAMIGQAIIKNVRPYDLVCRFREDRFAVALRRCPARFAKSIGERVTGNVQRLLLERAPERYRSGLHLRWSAATMPGDASTPVELLHLAENLLPTEAS